MIVREVVSFMEEEGSFYRGAQWRENGHLIEVVPLTDGEWSCYIGGQFKGGRMVMLHFNGSQNGHVNEVVFNGGSMVSIGGQYNGGRMLLTEVESLNEGEWSFYRGDQLNGGRMVMLKRWSV